MVCSHRRSHYTTIYDVEILGPIEIQNIVPLMG
jgi:hypothetical protein